MEYYYCFHFLSILTIWNVLCDVRESQMAHPMTDIIIIEYYRQIEKESACVCVFERERERERERKRMGSSLGTIANLNNEMWEKERRKQLSDDGFSTNCVWWRRTIWTRTTRRWWSTSKTSTTIRPSSIDPPTRLRSPKRTTATSQNESYRSICRPLKPPKQSQKSSQASQPPPQTTTPPTTHHHLEKTRLHRSFVSCLSALTRSFLSFFSWLYYRYYHHIIRIIIIIIIMIIISGFQCIFLF